VDFHSTQPLLQQQKNTEEKEKMIKRNNNDDCAKRMTTIDATEIVTILKKSDPIKLLERQSPATQPIWFTDVIHPHKRG